MWADFLDLLFPESCVLCENILIEDEKHFCFCCEQAHIQAPTQTIDKTLIGKRNPELNVFRELNSLFLYEKDNPIQKSVYAIKYKKKEALAVYFGQLIGRQLLQQQLHYDLLVPVPVDNKRRKERGYNQSQKLAEGIQQVTGWNIDENNILTKPVNRLRQSQKNRMARWDLASFSFAGKAHEPYRDKKILLVDDVLTTGNTLLACHRELQRHHFENISAITFAYA